MVGGVWLYLNEYKARSCELGGVCVGDMEVLANREIVFSKCKVFMGEVTYVTNNV